MSLLIKFVYGENMMKILLYVCTFILLSFSYLSKRIENNTVYRVYAGLTIASLIIDSAIILYLIIRAVW